MRGAVAQIGERLSHGLRSARFLRCATHRGERTCRRHVSPGRRALSTVRASRVRLDRSCRRRKRRHRRVVRAAIHDQAAAVRVADDGQRAGLRMRAALGAARNVKRQRPVEQRRRRMRYLRSQVRALEFLPDAQIGAPGAGHDVAARIVGCAMKPRLLGRVDQRRGFCVRHANEQQRAPRRCAHARRAGAFVRRRQAARARPHPCGRRRAPMPSAKRPSRRRMHADRFCRRARRRSGRLDQTTPQWRRERCCVPSLRMRSRGARLRRPCAAIIARSRRLTSIANSGATADRSAQRLRRRRRARHGMVRYRRALGAQAANRRAAHRDATRRRRRSRRRLLARAAQQMAQLKWPRAARRASTPASIASVTSRPASGSVRIATPSAAAMPSAATAAAEGGGRGWAEPAHLKAAARRDLDDAVAVGARPPRTRLANAASSGIVPVAVRAAPAVRRRFASARRGPGRRRGGGIGVHVQRLRLQRLRGRHRYRCGADARAAAARRIEPVGDGARGSGIFAQQKLAHLRVGEIGRRARDRSARSAPRRWSRRSRPADRRFRRTPRRRAAPWRIWPAMKRGLTARARTMRASAAASGRARGRCGSVRSSITRSGARPSAAAAAAKPPTKATSSAPSSRSRPGSSLGCTSRSAPATRAAKAPVRSAPSPSAPP